MAARPGISAHQGGGEVYPEQTYEAFDHAARSGAEYVEFDVRRLADGTLVCYHDPAGLTYGELCAHAGYEVPTVRRVLELVAGRCRGHIDLKDAGYETEVAALALDSLGPDGFVVTSMEDRSLRRIADAFPGVATGLSLGRGVGDVSTRRLPAAIVTDLFPADRLRACGATWAAVNRRLAPWVLTRCVRLGIATMVWTVDRDDQIVRFLADPRVDVLVTNRPLHALRRRSQDHRP